MLTVGIFDQLHAGSRLACTRLLEIVGIYVNEAFTDNTDAVCMLNSL